MARMGDLVALEEVGCTEALPGEGGVDVIWEPFPVLGHHRVYTVLLTYKRIALSRTTVRVWSGDFNSDDDIQN